MLINRIYCPKNCQPAPDRRRGPWGGEGIKKQLLDAGVNHCLSFEQVSDELIEQYHIPTGDFDTITGCKYSIPSYPECSYQEGRLLD